MRLNYNHKEADNDCCFEGIQAAESKYFIEKQKQSHKAIRVTDIRLYRKSRQKRRIFL